MGAIMLANLAAYSAQLACLALAGGAAALLLNVNSAGAAGVRYAYWRALLVLCLALPLLQGRHAAQGTVTDGTETLATEAIGLSLIQASPGQEAALPFLPLVPVFLLTGIVLRIAWIAISIRRLGDLRREGRDATCEEHDELQRTLGTRAAIRWVSGLGQPVTFGVWRPVVLLPETLRDRSLPIQRAVLCHELLHVQRRDWVWLLAEELVRAAFWFHPGVWWLISRIQLAREEVVDEFTVLATGARREYIHALLTFADETRLAPAAAFSRRRHLFCRIVRISKESAMSSRRVVIACAATAVVVLAGSWLAVGAFPLQQSLEVVGGPAPPAEPGPLERRANPITPENPIPRRFFSLLPRYPEEARTTGLRATVRLLVTLDQFGRVAEVRGSGVPILMRREGDQLVFSAVRPGPDDPRASASAMQPFVKAAFDAVRQWQYDPPANAPISFVVGMAFSPDNVEAGVIQHGTPSTLGIRPGYAPPPPPPPPPPPATAPGAIAEIERSMSELAARFDGWTEGALRVGGAIKPPLRVTNVNPVYPDAARAAGVQGVVVIEARLEPDGRVSQARILRSVPLLDQAALDAVMQWEYEPTLLNGVPVPILLTVTTSFTLRR
jgi:TonB family protein